MPPSSILTRSILVSVFLTFGAFLQVEDETLMAQCIHLFKDITALLEETVVAVELWEDSSMAARDLVRPLFKMLLFCATCIC